MSGQHGEGARLIECGLDIAAVGGIAGHGPGTRLFGNLLLDQLRAARIAQIDLIAQEQHSRNWLSLRQTAQQLGCRDTCH